MRKKAFIASILIYSLLFLIPLLIVLSNTSFKEIIGFLKDNYYRHIIGFSFQQALFSTIGSLIVGLPGAWIISHLDFKYKKAIKVIYYIPFILPSILVVLGFITSYGKNGFINNLMGSDTKFLYSYKAIIAAHVFYNFPIICNIVSEKWKTLDANIENEARTAGANEFVIFKEITLPRLINSILSAAIIVFLFCFSSFAIILVLGGSPRLTSLEVEIYRQARISLNISKASSLAFISLIFTSCIVLLYSFTSKNSFEENTSITVTNIKNTRYFTRIFTYIYLLITALFLILPIIGIVFKAFSFDVLNQINISSLINTFLIAFFSSAITVLMSVALCSVIRTKEITNLDSLFLLPMATSSIIIGLGYFIICKYFTFIPDIVLIILCHSVLNLSYAIKSIYPIYKSIPKEFIEEAQLNGMNDSEILKNIELPYVKNSALSTFAFCFALSCGELNATIMIASGKLTTIPLQIQRMISSYNYSGACLMGVIMVLMCTGTYVLCETLKIN